MASFALKLQELANESDRVLVVGRVAELRSADGWFTTQNASELFEHLRVPSRSTSQRLSDLSNRRTPLTIRQPLRNAWSLTPIGRQNAENLIGEIDPRKIEAELLQSGAGSVFGSARHLIVPASFAPPALSAGISRLLERYPFEQNVFLMTRYDNGGQDNHAIDPIGDVIETLRKVSSDHGLNLHLASDRQAEDTLFNNVAACMWACQFGIGILEDRVEEGINDNVILELGAMLMTGRRCAILKDKRLDRKDIPSDLVGHIYKSVELDDLDEVASAIDTWITDDLLAGAKSI